MLETDQLEHIRSVQKQFLPDTVTVIHPTVSASYGSRTISGCTTATYNARLALPRGSERPEPSRYTEFSAWVLTLQHDATVSASDYVLDASGHEYRVLSVDEPKSWNTAIRCNLELLR